MLLGKLDFNSTIAGWPELSAVECKNIFSSAKHSFSLLLCFQAFRECFEWKFSSFSFIIIMAVAMIIVSSFFLSLSNRRRFGMFTWQSGKCKKDNLISLSFFSQYAMLCSFFTFFSCRCHHFHLTSSSFACRELSSAPHWMLFWRLHWRWLRWHSRDIHPSECCECRVWY